MTVLITVSIGLASLYAVAQSRKPSTSKSVSCELGGASFRCPDGAKLLASLPTARVFKRIDDDDELYVFVGVGDAKDIIPVIRNVVSKNRLDGANPYEWKIVKDPLHMDTNTANLQFLNSFFGLGKTDFIEIKFFRFSYLNKNYITGYAESQGEDDPRINKAFFEKAEGLSDTAVGCNSIADLFNSLTKPKEKASCTISGIG
jgi:hypothetical protein